MTNSTSLEVLVEDEDVTLVSVVGAVLEADAVLFGTLSVDACAVLLRTLSDAVLLCAISVDAVLLGTLVDAELLGTLSVDVVLLGTASVDAVMMGTVSVDAVVMGTLSVDRVMMGTLSVVRVMMGTLSVVRVMMGTVSGEAVLRGTTSVGEVVVVAVLLVVEGAVGVGVKREKNSAEGENNISHIQVYMLKWSTKILTKLRS